MTLATHSLTSKVGRLGDTLSLTALGGRLVSYSVHKIIVNTMLSEIGKLAFSALQQSISRNSTSKALKRKSHLASRLVFSMGKSEIESR